MTTNVANPPKAFLSFAWEDHHLAQAIAEGLQAQGVDVWWAQWEICAGDSLRQKIDQGLLLCTHFIVLLTPNSIDKPWVKQEMDAGLMRKIRDQAKFIPLRAGVSAEDLPPLLAGILSPQVDASAIDLEQLINDIHGVTRKPILGKRPISLTTTTDRYSLAAMAVAKVFVDETQNGLFGECQYTYNELAAKTGLSTDDVRDAVFEMRGFLKDMGHNRVMDTPAFFSEFDGYWQKWHPEQDALRLAADIVNNPQFTALPREIAEQYDWEPRRLNPALAFLLQRDLLVDYGGISTAPYLMYRVVGKDGIRRFLKSKT